MGRVINPLSQNLTLTSVVFELCKSILINKIIYNLTLTSVVFESALISISFGLFLEFNFNKCCI